MNTYGFHSIHGRAPTLATGLKIARPDLHGLGHHRRWGRPLDRRQPRDAHVLRRNVGSQAGDVQQSHLRAHQGPGLADISEFGKRTKSTPEWARSTSPFNATVSSRSTLRARRSSARTRRYILPRHISRRRCEAAGSEHKGSAFIEVLQNCNIFNDHAWESVTSKEGRQENGLYLEHGKPCVFGKNQDKGIRLRGMDLEVVELGGSTGPEDCLVWDEDRPNPALAFVMAQLEPPDFPTPLGVFRKIEKPSYESGVVGQIQHEEERLGTGTLEELIGDGDTWTVDENGQIT